MSDPEPDAVECPYCAWVNSPDDPACLACGANLHPMREDDDEIR